MHVSPKLLCLVDGVLHSYHPGERPARTSLPAGGLQEPTPRQHSNGQAAGGGPWVDGEITAAAVAQERPLRRQTHPATPRGSANRASEPQLARVHAPQEVDETGEVC